MPPKNHNDDVQPRTGRPVRKRRITKIIRDIIVFNLKFFVALLVTYAVVFSITATVALIYGYKYVTRPIRQVQALKTNNPGITLYMAQQKQELRKQNKPDSLKHIFVPLDSIAPCLVKAVIAAEDDGFFIHPGFDISAMARAFELNRERNQLSHGASTITQQLAKNLFAGDEKSFIRKWQELLYAVLMESILGKNRILELYLNYAQWGPTVYGCEAAAQQYYKKSSSRLTFDQAVRLAAVLAQPEKLNPYNYKSAFIARRLSVIANNLYRRHSINDSAFTALGGSDSLRERMLENKRQRGLQESDSFDVDPGEKTEANGKKHLF